MTTKAIISRRGPESADAARSDELGAAEDLRLRVEIALPHASLVVGEREQMLELQDRGFRVKLLEDTNIIDVGGYRIDIESDSPSIPEELRVPVELRSSWLHHLVQLIAPPEESWINGIERVGIDVVETIGAYGLFVVSPPTRLDELRTLPYVAWSGAFEPAYRIAPNLRGLSGLIKHVNIGVFPATAVDDVRQAILSADGVIVDQTEQPARYGEAYGVLVIDVDAGAIPLIARRPPVRWLEYQGIDRTLDERSAQIVAENTDGAAPPNTAPVVGYQANLAGLGLSGAGVTIGIVDSGVDTHVNATMHADLAGRMTFFVDASAGATTVDTNGHGTHVAGIAVGNAASGGVDPQGFLLGQGVAPGSQFGSVNPISTGGPFMSDNDRVLNVVGNNGRVMNNSWGVTGGAGSGYTARSRNYDQLVRDPNPGAAGLEHLVIVSAAGNDGPGVTTIGGPWEAKNPIIVGNSLNFRPGEGDADDIRGLRGSSSRGPAVDGRIMPTIVAPGTDILSARSTVDANPAVAGVQRPRTPYTDTGGIVHADHTRMTGTSMASPHVAGLCALLIEWWRGRTGGRNPSPALLKALLVNAAEDLVGGPDGTAGGVLANIPNNHQGWGRVSLENIVLQPPMSDRGPRIFSDQRNAFTAAGQEYTIRVAPADTGRPLRITVVWTDAAGAVNANPALVNDLDLEVLEVSSGDIYRGNVFANGFSTTGGTFNNIDNVECAYIQNPTGVYQVTVIAATVAASANPDIVTPWQDFALVIDNAQVPATAPTSVVPVLDRSGSMIFFGYEAVTRTSSRQFVDLLSVDDSFGVVSFGDDGLVEFPPAPQPAALQTIVDQNTRDSGKAEIDGITFGGCTFMGDGIANGGNLLAGAGAASRAMVLFSDGYDNKGCDQANPAKPTALQAVAALPAGLRVFTCAMGPVSDQALLDQIATATGGRYYFMPTIDDLFEIYNYIRGQVIGDAIIANASAQASTSRVAAVVDACASQATFTVAWPEPGLAFAHSEATKPHEICVRLRTPSGRLLHPHDSAVRRTVSDGYVAFDLAEPLPGRWFIEVSTVRETHTRYTAAGFVRSPLRLELTPPRGGVPQGGIIKLAARVLDGDDQLTGLRGTAQVIAPVMGVPTLLDKFRRELDAMRPLTIPDGDSMPPDIAKLVALRARLLDENQQDLFATRSQQIRLTSTAQNTLTSEFAATGEPGTYNIVLTVAGTSPRCRSRLERRDMISVRVT